MVIEFEENAATSNPVTFNEDVLLQSARAGNGDAFMQLIERQNGFGLSTAYSILRNRGDAEDEVQNACLQAWRHLGEYLGEGSFGGWFGRIVSNQCLMRLRVRKPIISIDEVFLSEDSFRLDLIDQRPLPEEKVGDTEVTDVVDKEIGKLPPLLRTVLIMRDLQELAMTEVATELGISTAAAKSRLMRARAELKRRLTKHLGASGCSKLIERSPRLRAAYVRAC